MELSSTLCRIQEAYQRARAASASLENVRIIAGNAATAWGVEALIAESREARRERALRKRQGDWQFSENPDRGFANL